MDENLNWDPRYLDKRWIIKRNRVRERDRYICGSCKEKHDSVEVHHMKYVGKDPWDTPDKYLVTLCIPCHRKTVDEEWRSFTDQFELNFLDHLTEMLKLKFGNQVRKADGQLKHKEGRVVYIDSEYLPSGNLFISFSGHLSLVHRQVLKVMVYYPQEMVTKFYMESILKFNNPLMEQYWRLEDISARPLTCLYKRNINPATASNFPDYLFTDFVNAISILKSEFEKHYLPPFETTNLAVLLGISNKH